MAAQEQRVEGVARRDVLNGADDSASDPASAAHLGQPRRHVQCNDIVPPPLQLERISTGPRADVEDSAAYQVEHRRLVPRPPLRRREILARVVGVHPPVVPFEQVPSRPLVFEVIEACERPEWQRVRVEVAPGISALQAAAARIGAPLGHDFCTVSLSDLMTPWPAIEKRLTAAAEGDFVVALYNPVSKRRTRQFARAAEILRGSRPRLRAGEGVTVITLDELSPERVDMLTVVLVGSSETRTVGRGDGGAWVYTPRGYAAKAGPAKAGSASEDAA